jgi:hypothetical protein
VVGADGVLGAAVDGVEVDGEDGVMLEVPGEEGAAGVTTPGAGADAAVVAGRFGQPVRKIVRASRGAASSVPRRCAISTLPW